MYAVTTNPYSLKIITGDIKGDGLKKVYLPPIPPADQILFKKQNKFVRETPSETLLKAMKEWRIKSDKEGPLFDKEFVSPYAEQIQAWEAQEWDRSTDGIWFWNNGTPTFITGFLYWYLSAWVTYFGHPIYRESDKEITYALLYCEEDPDCYGMLLNTIRRYGKSSLMGAWAVYRTSRNYHHYCGMQGEKSTKISAFYNQMILKPFKKLPYYYTPTYDISSTQSKEIKFEKTAYRGRKSKKEQLIEIEYGDDSLESIIDYRASGESEYDGSILHSYLAEEPGKTLEANINERWKIVKPCLRKGRAIRGKAFMGTTVEFMDVTNKGGKAYKKLFYESDFGDRGKDGRTKSGLYAFFLPGDCAYEDFLDEWGHPMREQAKQSILQEREAVRDNPKDHSDLVRKYPLYVKEIFYISTDRCVFNATILQDRLSDLNMSATPFTSKVEYYWEGGVRFSKVLCRHNPINGWAQVTMLPPPEECNKVSTRNIGGFVKYSPEGDDKHRAGVDPVDHGVVVEGRGGDEEMVTTRRSRPVMFVKRLYDSNIDGPMHQEILEERARNKYPYKTNQYVLMMDTRPNDPNVMYERALMICWFYGCSVQVEDQKPGLKNWFHLYNCEAFLQQKYVAISDTKKVNPFLEGTPASTLSINEYTDAKAFYIEYFGHTICFRELIEDDLVFNPKKTTEFDYSVASGWTELAGKIQPKITPRVYMDLGQFLPMFNGDGEIVN